MEKNNVSMVTRLQLRERVQEKVFMHHNWRDLLFMSWEFDPEEIQKKLPPGLFVDTFQGKGYLTLIPFFLRDLSLAPLPAVPRLSHFMEVNLRTYVYDKNGIPGVWFYSLDLNSKLGVFIANRIFSLPYFLAEFKSSVQDDVITLKGNRLPHHKPLIDVSYLPDKEVYFADPESLDFFLVERYTLYSYHKKQLERGQIFHTPYPLSRVAIKHCEHHLFEINGLQKPNRVADHMVFSRGVNVDFFKFKKS